MHKIGPFTVYMGSIMRNDNHCIVEEPAILLDNDPDMVTIHRVGNFNIVQNRYQTMIARLTATNDALCKEMAQTLLLLKFNEDTFSKDDICTIFNTAVNCTGHPIFKSIIAKDMDTVRSDLTRLQNIGY